MFFLVAGAICLLVGAFVKFLLLRLSNFLSVHDTVSSVTNTKKSDCSVRWFDPFSVKIGPSSNVAIEAIFDAIIENYISCWYRTVSSNVDFTIQVKLFLQYLSASLIRRARTIHLNGQKLSGILESFVVHAEHIIFITAEKCHENDIRLEDNVVRTFGPHLHSCMVSRSTEIAYLRALVNRLLPHVGLSPAFRTTSRDSQSSPTPSTLRRQFTGTSSPPSTHNRRVPTSSSNKPLRNRTNRPVHLGPNRACYSFFVEILSTCVLLPAMDSLANPDFINKLIILALEEDDEQMKDKKRKFDTSNDYSIPVLNSYIQEWKEWLDKQPSRLKMEAIFQHDRDFLSFVQYIKSVQASVPLTAVLLLRDIDQRVSNDTLSTDTCQEVRSQLLHVLASLHGSSDPSTELVNSSSTLDELDGSVSFAPTSVSSQPLGCLFDLPDEFECLLKAHLSQQVDATSLTHLIQSPVWKNGSKSAYEALGRRYLSMYLESPEYLSRLFNVPVAQRKPVLVASPELTSPTLAVRPLPKFGESLKSMFTAPVVDGSSGMNAARISESNAVKPKHINSSGNLGSCARDQADHLTNNTKLTSSQHKLHAHYQLQTHKIDLSTWHVFICGLSWPEVIPGRRLIDQLMMQPSGFRGVSNSGRAQDARFNEKIATEMKQLQSPDAATNYRHSAHLMFTVKSERIVNDKVQLIARVFRKFDEFYILEHKLIQFHGSLIVKQLRQHHLRLRSFEFMESKRDELDDFLQYLIAQPCLRNSELLYGFLTFETAFNTNVLFDIDLGRFVKSVPRKLIREKGQYLDRFLIDFYVSCSPQPLNVDPMEPHSAEPVFTVFPNGGAGTLGGLDLLTSPDHYSLNSNASTVPSSMVVSHVNQKMPGHPVMPPSSSSSAKRELKLTWIDNRLRSKAFWNNVGLDWERYKLRQHESCELPVPQSDDFFRLVCYLFNAANSNAPLPVSSLPHSLSPAHTETEPETSVEPDLSTEIPPPTLVHPSDIMNEDWSEALLNGPSDMLIESISSSLDPSYLQTDVPCENPVSSRPPPSSFVDEGVANVQSQIMSIEWDDVVTTGCYLGLLIKHFSTILFRRFISWILLILQIYFPAVIDRLLSNWVLTLLRRLFADEMLAIALREVKEVVFSPTPPTSETEKLERREQALNYLQQTALDIGIGHVMDEETVKNYIRRIFFCFQHPKWNKQLSYVLLDQVMIDLFPELEEKQTDEK